MTDQPTLFDAARIHARRTDPYTSDKALKAIAKDTTLMHHIWNCAKAHCWPPPGEECTGYFNDTMLWEWCEIFMGSRQQRNVVARSRGLLEQAGLFRRIGVREYRGQELMHYEINTPFEFVNP